MRSTRASASRSPDRGHRNRSVSGSATQNFSEECFSIRKDLATIPAARKILTHVLQRFPLLKEMATKVNIYSPRFLVERYIGEVEKGVWYLADNFPDFSGIGRCNRRAYTQVFLEKVLEMGGIPQKDISRVSAVLARDLARVIAIAVITDEDFENTLLVQNAFGNRPQPPFWPKGKIEFGEDPAFAVIREVYEETGLYVARNVFDPHQKYPSGIKMTLSPAFPGGAMTNTAVSCDAESLYSGDSGFASYAATAHATSGFFTKHFPPIYVDLTGSAHGRAYIIPGVRVSQMSNAAPLTTTEIGRITVESLESTLYNDEWVDSKKYISRDCAARLRREIDRLKEEKARQRQHHKAMLDSNQEKNAEDFAALSAEELCHLLCR